VTRDDEGNRVAGEGGADRPGGSGPSDLGCDPSVGPDLAGRDLSGLAKDGLLERRHPGEVESQLAGFAFGNRPVEVCLDRRRYFLGRDCRPPVALGEALLEFLWRRGEVDRRDAPVVERHEHPAEHTVPNDIAVGEAGGRHDPGEEMGGRLGAQAGEMLGDVHGAS
jgi:hypothetical protein